MMQRSAERMAAHGRGDRAIARLERQMERVQSRMDRGYMDAEVGQQYLDSLKGIVSDLTASVSAQEDVAPDGDQPTAPQTPYAELNARNQKWVRMFHTRMMGIEKIDGTEKAVATINERIDSITKRAESGEMNAEQADKLVETLKYIASRMNSGGGASESSAMSIGDTSPTAGNNSAGANEVQWDWEPWKPEAVDASKRPYKALTGAQKRWVGIFAGQVEKAAGAEGDEAARALIQKRLDSIRDRAQYGLMKPEHAANMTAVLEHMMSRYDTADKQGAFTFSNVRPDHRTHMYQRAASQYSAVQHLCQPPAPEA